MNNLALVAAPAPMTESEARRLVFKINNQASEIRSSLLELHEREGWRSLGYSSWRECAQEEFRLGQAQVYNLLSAAEVARNISAAVENSGAIPERHLRPLAKLPEERQAEVYLRAAETAPEGRVTAEHIEQTARVMGVARERWGARAAASNERDYEEAENRMNPIRLAYLYKKFKEHIPFRLRQQAIDWLREVDNDEFMQEFERLMGEERVDD